MTIMMNAEASRYVKMELNNVLNNKSSIHLAVTFRKLCIATVSLPLITLLFCFVTAYIFQQDDIHETHCRVYNVLPSISAITGISPQRYLWRVSIALHVAPRLLIASVYHSYYRKILRAIDDLPTKLQGSRLLNLSYWLNITEVASLCGVTYISNRENYSVHEKIFIMFMVSSLTYMLTTVRLGRLVTPNAQSLQYKQFLFITSIVSTIGLVIFFLKHRLLCHDLAFSWFSLCEYVIASANMGFHFTVVLDFPQEQLIIGSGLPVIKTKRRFVFWHVSHPVKLWGEYRMESKQPHLYTTSKIRDAAGSGEQCGSVKSGMPRYAAFSNANPSS